MTKYVLAFFSLAVTACGETITLTPARTDGYGFLDRLPSLDGSDYYSSLDAGSYPILQRTNDNILKSYRPWAKFDLGEVHQSISSATIKIQVGPIEAFGRAPFFRNVIIQMHDVGNIPPTTLLALATQEEKEAAWADLSSGAYYGSYDASPGVLDGWTVGNEPRFVNGQIIESLIGKWNGFIDVTIPLSPLAVRDINATSGGQWNVGFSLPDVPLDPITVPPSVIGLPPTVGLREYTGVNLYGRWQLSLTYGPPPPIGDFDHSGRTDQGDLDFVLLNWGMLDQEELDAVLLTWGQGSSLPPVTVPEPHPLHLLLALGIPGYLLWVFKRNRRREDGDE